MESKLKLIIQSFGNERVKPKEPISNHSATKIGGIAELFFVAVSAQDIISIISVARELKVPFFLFGTGSKMLISDNGFSGVVIKNRTSRISVIGVKGKVSRTGLGVDEAIVEVESGVTLRNLSDFLKKQKLKSEFIRSTGSVGGSLNFDRDLREKVKVIKVLDENTEKREIKVENLSTKKHIILSVIFIFKSIT